MLFLVEIVKNNIQELVEVNYNFKYTPKKWLKLNLY